MGDMAGALLPLFPLHVVVFPRTALPLHIFEERYKEMVGNAIRDNSEFGVVLAKEEGIVNAGCTVVVDQLLQMHPDGRMDVVTNGRRRFEIQSLNEDKEYLQAEVAYFDDEDFAPAPAELRNETLSQWHVLSKFGAASEREPNLEDPQLSFQVAQMVPDLDFQNSLLRHRSETARLRQLNKYLAEYIPRQKTIERMKAIAPTNGFGGKPAGI